MKYRIVTGYIKPSGGDVKDIESIINSMVEAGYKPIDGLVKIEGNKFAQAMIYTEDDDDMEEHY
jgi:hypothetical protein